MTRAQLDAVVMERDLLREFVEQIAEAGFHHPRNAPAELNDLVRAARALTGYVEHDGLRLVQ